MTTHQPESNKINWLPWIIFIMGLAIGWWAIPLLLSHLSLGWLAGSQAVWYLTRASGTVGYLLMAASIIWGLLLSTKLIKQAIPASISLAMHNYLSWSSIALTAFHAFLLLFDKYYTFNLFHLLVPFIGPYNPVGVGLGIIAFYIMLLTAGSFYFRKQIGQKRWRKLHYLTFAAFILATLHGWTAGTDSVQLATMYVASGLSVLFLTLYRILSR
ncbi:MAG: hypothetical protein GY796_15645 [Chloroflexi bacterium]|nr:hypothetical protein [Chloroflexota bacterium]